MRPYYSFLNLNIFPSSMILRLILFKKYLLYLWIFLASVLLSLNKFSLKEFVVFKYSLTFYDILLILFSNFNYYKAKRLKNNSAKEFYYLFYNEFICDFDWLLEGCFYLTWKFYRFHIFIVVMNDSLMFYNGFLMRSKLGLFLNL